MPMHGAAGGPLRVYGKWSQNEILKKADYIHYYEENDVATLPAIIMDNGTSTSKIGFGGEKLPRFSFPPIVGRYRGQSTVYAYKDAYCGHEAIALKGQLSLKYCIEHGTISNFDDMERIWHYSFYDELRVAPEQHPIILTEKVLNPKQNRENIVQIMFETFNIPLFYIGSDSVFALYASGRTTGLVLSSGSATTRTVPIYEG
eukprot:212762_1